MFRAPVVVCLFACLTPFVPAAGAGSTASLHIALVKRVPSLPPPPSTATRAAIAASFQALDGVWRVVVDESTSRRGVAAVLRVTLVAR